MKHHNLPVEKALDYALACCHKLQDSFKIKKGELAAPLIYQ